MYPGGMAMFLVEGVGLENIGLSPEAEAALEEKTREIQMMEKYNIFAAAEEEKWKRKRKSINEKKQEEEVEETRRLIKIRADEDSRMLDWLYSRPPEQCWTIREGLSCDPLGLLASPSGKRDYLIRFKGEGRRRRNVKINQLKTKYILFYFWWLSKDGFKPHQTYSDLNADLEEVHKSPITLGDFEVVFVALGTEKD
ncbi:hypothetical protein OROMI_024405 [Orobanche minor]